MRSLALHQITAPGTDAIELIDIAAQLGCNGVCVFVHEPADRISVPGGPRRRFPIIAQTAASVVRKRLRENNQRVINVEFFPIGSETDVSSYLPALALGAMLGAKRAVTHIHDTDGNRATEKLGKLCDLALSVGLGIGLEFMSMSRGCGSLEAAVRMVGSVGRHNLAIAVDALHLVRSGGIPKDLVSIPAERLAYAQICDGRGLAPADSYMAEAMDRLIPGEGDFPLNDFIQSLPVGLDLDVEVPSTHLHELGITALQHATRAVQAARLLLERLAHEADGLPIHISI
jgi:sugar phosphate isomerase/epimerase